MRRGGILSFLFSGFRHDGSIAVKLEVTSTALETRDGRTAHKIHRVNHATGCETTIVRRGGRPDVTIYSGPATKEHFID